jgi:hypothetical protein
LNRLGIYLLLFVVIFLAGTKALFAEPSQPVIQTSVGNINFSFSKEDGVCLFYRGVNLIRRSTLVVHYGNWSAPYFTYVKGETTASIQPVDGGKEVVLNHSSDSFTGVHKIRIYPDKISFEFHGRMLQGISDGMMDYDLGYFSANPLAGCPFNAKGGDTPISSTFPLLPRKQDDYLFPQTVKTLEIDSRIGRISMDVTGDLAGLTCFDARKNHGAWAERSPIFWIGAFHQPLTADKEYTHTVTLSFHSDPMIPAGIQKGKGNQVSVIESKQVRLSTADQLLIIPEPKQLRVRSHDFTINSKTRIVVSKTATQKDLSGARLFCEDLAIICKQ